MTKVGIFYFSHIAYNSFKQRPQQIFLNWQKNSNSSFEFYFMEVSITGFIKKIIERTNKNQNVLIIPFFRFFKDVPLIGNLVNLYNNLVKSLIFRSKNLTKIKKAIVISTPLWEPFISKNEFDIICYDYLDSIELFSKVDPKNSILLHKKLVSKSDMVFTTAEKLKEDILLIIPDKKVVMVSNGVDPDYFQINKNNNITDYKRTSTKIVGYVGALYDWIDFEIIYKSAEAMPDVDFILVGPISNENKKFINKKPENVYLLGEKPYELVPSYIEIFDVAIIPFKKGDIAESTDPIKIYEYFSLGKPVVSTYLKQLTKFEEEKLLKIAIDENEFVEALKFYLYKDTHQLKAERKKIAENNCWSNKANLMIKSIDDILKK